MTDLTAPSGAPRTARQLRDGALAAAGQLGARARALAARVRAHRFTLALPGLAGIALVSSAAGLRLGLWAGLGAAGVFLLRIDSRL